MSNTQGNNRSFSMFIVLKKSIEDYLTHVDPEFTPVGEAPNGNTVDIAFTQFVRFIMTSYGGICFDEGMAIAQDMTIEGEKKVALRFRSEHPLFADKTYNTLFQNACLISAMIYLGLPILDYFDGDSIL